MNHLIIEVNTPEVLSADFFGSDTRHALAAWTSTSRNLTVVKQQRLPKFLEWLYEEEHTTPFEKSYLEFLVRTDIATHIHILKHRIGVSVNAESARYKEINDNHGYVPADWPKEERIQLLAFYEAAVKLYHDTAARLTPLLGRRRAKETARFYLPYNNAILSNVSFNFRSFAHFLYKRYAPGAQYECVLLARAMLKEVRRHGEFNASLNAIGFSEEDQQELDARIEAERANDIAKALSSNEKRT